MPNIVELVRNLVAHGDAREGNWRGNWRMEWVASTLTPSPNVVYPALLKLMRTLRLPAVDWTDAPTDLNWLVRFGERRNLVSARVPSRSARAILKTSILEPAIVPYSSCRRSWQYWVWAGQQVSDFWQRLVFFSLFSRYRSPVARSAFCQIDTPDYFFGCKASRSVSVAS